MKNNLTIVSAELGEYEFNVILKRWW